MNSSWHYFYDDRSHWESNLFYEGAYPGPSFVAPVPTYVWPDASTGIVQLPAMAKPAQQKAVASPGSADIIYLMSSNQKSARVLVAGLGAPGVPITAGTLDLDVVLNNVLIDPFIQAEDDTAALAWSTIVRDDSATASAASNQSLTFRTDHYSRLERNFDKHQFVVVHEANAA